MSASDVPKLKGDDGESSFWSGFANIACFLPKLLWNSSPKLLTDLLDFLKDILRTILPVAQNLFLQTLRYAFALAMLVLVFLIVGVIFTPEQAWKFIWFLCGVK